MTDTLEPAARVVDANAQPWAQHPRFAEILTQQLLASSDNPLASVNRVQVPPDGVIALHQHPSQTETVYVLAGQSRLSLGADEVPFNSGQIVAIPPGTAHTLHNTGSEPVLLLCFFTPPTP